MKYAILVCLLFMLAACQTPEGITSTATLVSKMTVQLNSNVSDYVAAANSQRTDDETRLVSQQQHTARKAAANADQFQILTLTGDDRTRALLTSLRTPVDPTLVTSPAAAPQSQVSALAQQFGKNSFDTSPLTDIATTTGALAKPLDTRDQLQALFSFSQQVYTDLKTLNAGAAGTTTTSTSPTPSTPKP